MKISEALFQELKSDMRALFLACRVSPSEVRETELWGIFHKICSDRAYNDAQPLAGYRRLLPYIGRKYCWLYDAGLNDANITAALKAALRDLKKEEIEKINGFLFPRK